jgi:hypothetical protein
VRRELQEQGYSEREISEFANRDDLATSAMADDVGPYGRCAIFPEKVLPNAHRMEDMVLIDIFPLLRSIRYLAQSSDYLHARKFLRILIQHEKAYRQISDPGRKASVLSQKFIELKFPPLVSHKVSTKGRETDERPPEGRVGFE